MTRLRLCLPVIAALVAFSGCGTDAREEPPTAAERRQALGDSAFGDLAEPMERAAEIEQLQRDRKREIDEALEQ